MAITRKDTLLPFGKKQYNCTDPGILAQQCLPNCFLFQAEVLCVVCAGKKGELFRRHISKLSFFQPGGQLLAKGTYTLNNTTFLLQKGGSLESALTHTSEKRNFIANSKGFSMASLASAEKAMPWQYGNPQKLRAATLSYSPA